MTMQRCVDELLMRGCGDWIDAAEVTSVAKFTGQTEAADSIRDLSLQLIREVVYQGLMEVGDLPKDGRRLELWPLSPEKILERVEREWNALGRNPTISEICWLQNTDKGNAKGEDLLRRNERNR